MAAAKTKDTKPISEDVQAQTVEELEKEALGPKKPKSGKPKEPKEKGPAGKLEISLFVSLFWVALLSVFILLVIFDPTKDSVIRDKVLVLIDRDAETREEYWAGDITDFQDWERELDELARELADQEARLELWEEDLDAQQDEVDDMRYEAETLLEALKGGSSSNGDNMTITVDLIQRAKAIERTDPAKAAQALEEADLETVVVICSLLGPKKLGPIFTEMSTDFFAELLNELFAIEDNEWDDWDW